jgi:hypothetical protein
MMIRDRGVCVPDDLQFVSHWADHARAVADFVGMGGWCDALAWQAGQGPNAWRVSYAIAMGVRASRPYDLPDRDDPAERLAPLWWDRGTYVGEWETTPDIAEYRKV